ncbi:MAG: ACP S-malonyltransferase [Alphaproteobacteria bacterium]|nr:ACP S-malonyltransferase [Alphaproteobacteria bacterium]
MARAFVFPGQGSQAVGMGRDLATAFPAAHQVFQEVDDALGQNLSRLMFEGPETDLVLTENAQPALMAVSMAVVRVVEKEAGHKIGQVANFVAGHSLGEYSALAAAGTFSLADTARLLKTRGQAMQKAVPVGQGAMVAVLGLGLDAVRAVTEEASQGEACQAANDNSDEQVVISGAAAAVARAAELAKAKGAKRAIMLPVSAPFHCALMEPAARVMEEKLGTVAMAPPSVPVIANVTASAVTDPAEIRRLLVEQVTALVRWRESILYMRAHDVDMVVELGAGKVLSGLVKRISKDMNALSVGAPGDIDALIKLF